MLEANAGYRSSQGGGDEQDAPDNPAIVAETKVDIPEANVADAVMLMDLRNTNALMFRNSTTSELNMVYRREDGNIGWVEPDAALILSRPAACYRASGGPVERALCS